MMSENDIELEKEFLKQQVTVHRKMANFYLDELWKLRSSDKIGEEK